MGIYRGGFGGGEFCGGDISCLLSGKGEGVRVILSDEDFVGIWNW
jgi:hypothetical protein